MHIHYIMKFGLENQKERGNFEYLNMDGSVILK
jgi:hypothetical protein